MRFLVALPAALLLATPSPAQERALVERGEELYARACISCHGPNGEGIEPRGPPLASAGEASARFYLETGRMPLREPGDPPRRGEPAYSEEEIDALVAYVGSLGDGPEAPEPDPDAGDVARGLKLYGDYCMGCHQIVGEGGVAVGAVAPALDAATPVEIAGAVRLGPYVMPAFDEETIDEQGLNDLIRYVEYARDEDDRGGWSIGHLGPIPEGLVTWLLGAAALVGAAIAIGERLR